MLLKYCILVSGTELIVYTQTILNMVHATFSIVFHLLLILCYAAVIPIHKNIKLNLSSSINYRDIALTSIFFVKLK